MRTAILLCITFACCAFAVASTDFFASVPSSGGGNPSVFEITVENVNNQGGSGNAFLTIPASIVGCTYGYLTVDIIAGSTLTTQTYTPSAGAAITLPASNDLLIVVSYDEKGVDESQTCSITITGQPHLVPCAQCNGPAPCCQCGTNAGTCSQTSTALCDTTGFTGGDPATSTGCWCSGAKQCHFIDTNCDTTVGFGECDLPHPVFPVVDTPPAGATVASTPYTTKPAQDGNTICFAGDPTIDLLFGEKIQYNAKQYCCTGIGLIVVPTVGNNLTPFCRLKSCPSQFTQSQCTLLYQYYYSSSTGNVANALCYTNCYTTPKQDNFFEAVIEPTPVSISGAVLAPPGSFNLHHNAARLHSPVLTATNTGATAGFNVACDFLGKISNSVCVPYDCGFYGTCINKSAYYYTGETAPDSKQWCWGACYLLP